MSAPVQGHLAMLLFSALVAGSFSLGSLIANLIDPMVVTVLRMALAAALMGAVSVATGRLSPAALRAPWRYLLLGGLFAAYFVLMFEGLKTAPPVSAAAVFTMTPPMAGLFGWMLMRQAMTGRMAVALSVGAAGALWVIFRADPVALTGFAIGRGEAIFLVGCAAHALYTPMVRRLNRGEPALVFTFGTLVGGTVVLTLCAWSALKGTDWPALPAIVWITVAYLTAFATALSFWLVQVATLRLPSAKVMAHTYLAPVWVILWQVALGDALPALRVLAGVAPIVLALLLLLKDDGPQTARKARSRASR